MTQNLEAIRRFILGGQAVFTVVSKRTGARRTFRVRKGEDVTGTGVPHGYYVDLLTGPNNDSDYRYLAYLFLGIDGLRLKPNKEAWGFDSRLILAWLIRLINTKNQALFEAQSEFHHAGKCCVCGRTLTWLADDPSSCAYCGEKLKDHSADELDACALHLGVG